jgi:glycerol kinase
MKKYILAIDQGTTGSTVALIDKKGKIVSSSNVEFPQIFPKPGLVEHNLDDIWSSIKKACKNTLKTSKADPTNIASIGITNQRETVALWDRQTGSQLHNAIVWQCRRTADICKRLKEDNHEKEFHKKTGLYLDPYFSGTKIKWLLETVMPKDLAQVCCGTIDTYLCFKLTNGNSFVTEPSNASRTLVYNIESNEWDKNLLSHLNIPIDILPEVKNSCDDFGKTSGLDFLPDGIPITGILGDQQAALFGQLCFQKGNIKCTYGTGAFLLMNSGEKISYSKNNLLTTIAWKDQHSTTYALEGSVFIAGAAV